MKLQAVDKLQALGFVLLGFALKWGMDVLTSSNVITQSSAAKAFGRQQPPPALVRSASSSNPHRNDFGWREVHIFRGPQGDLDKIGDAVGYSQIGQDKVVLQLLNHQKKGYFVDLAANHAVVLSNTYPLERHHAWNGLCIEPNPTYQWGHLQRNCTLVQAIIGAHRMEQVSVVLPTGSDGPGGGIISDKFDNKADLSDNQKQAAKRKNTKPAILYTVPLSEILDRFEAPFVIDYLSLDVEGAEFYVMQSFAFNRYKIRVMTVERPNQDLVDLFYQHGYVYLAAFNQWGDETMFVLKSEIPALNLTVVDTTLHKTSSKLMEVPKDTLREKPRVREQRLQ